MGPRAQVGQRNEAVLAPIYWRDSALPCAWVGVEEGF